MSDTHVYSQWYWSSYTITIYHNYQHHCCCKHHSHGRRHRHRQHHHHQRHHISSSDMAFNVNYPNSQLGSDKWPTTTFWPSPIDSAIQHKTTELNKPEFMLNYQTISAPASTTPRNDGSFCPWNFPMARIPGLLKVFRKKSHLATDVFLLTEKTLQPMKRVFLANGWPERQNMKMYPASRNNHNSYLSRPDSPLPRGKSTGLVTQQTHRKPTNTCGRTTNEPENKLKMASSRHHIITALRIWSPFQHFYVTYFA